MEILKIIAVMRLILPRQDLKVAGGREKNLRDLQSWIFYVGATSGLIGNYLATTGRANEEDLQMIRDLELTLVRRPRRRRRPGGAYGGADGAVAAGAAGAVVTQVKRCPSSKQRGRILIRPPPGGHCVRSAAARESNPVSYPIVMRARVGRKD